MSKLVSRVKKFVKKPGLLISYLLSKKYIEILFPDKFFLKLKYRVEMGKKLNLKNPKSFNEKLQWLKLNDRNPEYTKMVDKYEAREYVAEKIGEEYLIPLLGVWDSVDDIDFESLPDKFVLKCTHDSGGVVVCRDKSKLNINDARKKLDVCLHRDFYKLTREWPYKDVKPRIIAEKFMVDKNEEKTQTGLTDYKFYCFNGVPKYAYVSLGLENHKTAKISFVTLDWEIAPFGRTDFAEFKSLPPKPTKFDEMIKLATVLSKDIRFLRVDFYEIDEKIYFGELTFFPGSGYTEINPEEWDYKLGDMINLD